MNKLFLPSLTPCSNTGTAKIIHRKNDVVFGVGSPYNRRHKKSLGILMCHVSQFRIFLLVALAGVVARSETLVGGFAGSTGRERVECVAGFVAPVWQEGAGTFLEVRGTFVQTEAGEGSAVVRLLDEKCPLTLVWHGTTGFQWVAQGGLPCNTPVMSTPSEPQSVTWRLRVRSLHNRTRGCVLETRQPDGTWQGVLETHQALRGVREWVEEGGVLEVGLAGPVEWGDDLQVKMCREGTLLMIL
jgi:hypothetical protein